VTVAACQGTVERNVKTRDLIYLFICLSDFFAIAFLVQSAVNFASADGGIKMTSLLSLRDTVSRHRIIGSCVLASAALDS
jgi:hypothetical protein